MKAAIASSLPVKLGIAIALLAHSTSRSRSMPIWQPPERFVGAGEEGRPGFSSQTGRVACSRAHVRQHAVAEEPNLVMPPLAPELEHDVRAAGLAIVLDRRDAFARRAGDRPALVEQRVADLGLRGEPSSLLHRLCDGADLLLLDPGQIEQRVRRALDVLHLVRE